MLTIRTADHLNDSTTIIEHNCAMALETEGKVLDKQAAELGANGVLLTDTANESGDVVGFVSALFSVQHRMFGNRSKVVLHSSSYINCVPY